MSDRQSHPTSSNGQAAFLLVIPGLTVAGFGLGLLAEQPLPWLLIGAGLGVALWGLIVAIARR